MTLLLLNEDELRQTLNLSDILTSVEKAFIASGERRVTIPGDFQMNLPDMYGTVDVKGAYLQDAPYYIIKVGNHFRHNPEINLPAKNGLIVVFDAATGFPAAILLDNGYLTNVRIGVTGALAAKYLANPTASRVAVIGTGRQAYIQLKALLASRPVSLVRVWGHTPLEADLYARRMVEDHDVNIEIAETVAEALRDAQIIIAAARAPEPLLDGNWLQPGAHLTVANTDSQTRQLIPNVFAKTQVIIAGHPNGSDIQHAVASGVITAGQIRGNLSELIQGRVDGRASPRQTTLADLSGLDWQDAVVATLALEKALFLGLGQRLDPGLEQHIIGQRIENLL